MHTFTLVDSKALGIKIPPRALVVSHSADVEPSGLVAIKVVEPFTWAWLGIKLAEGVVSYIGGKLFQEAFFPDVSNNDVIDALSRKIDEAVQRLQKYIDAKLEQKLVDTAQRKVFTLYALMREFENDPTGDPARLSIINAESRELWDLLDGRGEAAFIPACHAASLKLAALSIIQRKSKSKGGLQNMVEFAELAITRITAWQQAIWENNFIYELTPPACNRDRDCGCSNAPPFKTTAGPGEGSGYAFGNCSCAASFRVNGRTLTFQGEGSGTISSAEDDAFKSAMQRAGGSYRNWKNQKDVILPQVQSELIAPSGWMLMQFGQARDVALEMQKAM